MLHECRTAYLGYSRRHPSAGTEGTVQPHTDHRRAPAGPPDCAARPAYWCARRAVRTGWRTGTQRPVDRCRQRPDQRGRTRAQLRHRKLHRRAALSACIGLQCAGHRHRYRRPGHLVRARTLCRLPAPLAQRAAGENPPGRHQWPGWRRLPQRGQAHRAPLAENPHADHQRHRMRAVHHR